MNRFNNQEEYQQYFDPDRYLKDYFSDVQGFMKDSLQTFYDIFQSGEHAGTKLLDLGCGPSIHTILSASRIFPDIYSSDLTDSNRQALDNWRRKDPSAHDWTPILEFCSKLEEISITDLEDRTRKAIKDVLPCDVLADTILSPGYGQFDCVITSCCLESACPDLTSYKDAVRKVADILKPGGTVVLFSFLDDEFYRSGDAVFGALGLSTDTIKESFKDAGFTALKCVYEHRHSKEEIEAAENYYSSSGYLFFTAQLSNKANE